MYTGLDVMFQGTSYDPKFVECVERHGGSIIWTGHGLTIEMMSDKFIPGLVNELCLIYDLEYTWYTIQNSLVYDAIEHAREVLQIRIEEISVSPSKRLAVQR